MNTLLITPLFLGNLRGWEWIIIFLVILLLFGGKKIRGLGKGVHSFKKGMQEARNEMEKPLEDEPETKETPRGKDRD